MTISNGIQTQIDFRQTRGHINANIIYTVLMQYNGVGKSKTTASKIILQAFISYDPSEPEDITQIYDLQTRLHVFKEKYKIQTKEDLKEEIKKKPLETVIPLLEPDLKNLSFPKDTPEADRLLARLNSVRFRDRGILINKFLYQYFAKGNSSHYNTITAARLMNWMKMEYRTMKGVDNRSLDAIVNIVWMLNRNLLFDDKFSIFDEDDYDISNESDLLRRLMGI